MSGGNITKLSSVLTRPAAWHTGSVSSGTAEATFGHWDSVLAFPTAGLPSLQLISTSFFKTQLFHFSLSPILVSIDISSLNYSYSGYQLGVL